MRTAKVIWAPYPYRAGFCVTDDTDAATLESVKAVYEFLSTVGLRTSKTIWAFKPSEPCGIPPLPESIQRGITCEDPDYLRYCQRLRERGFEICLHGASAGNNVRARTIAAFEVLERHFGRAGTYVCHAKNAENIYWHEKVAPPGPMRWLDTANPAAITIASKPIFISKPCIAFSNTSEVFDFTAARA